MVSSGDASSIPVASLARRDLRLRPDSRALFEKVGFNADQLIFRDDVAVRETDRLALVDHNRLRDDGLAAASVAAVITTLMRAFTLM